jgi:hypothetical protein
LNLQAAKNKQLRQNQKCQPIDNLHEKKAPKLPNMKKISFPCEYLNLADLKMKQLNLNREKAFAYSTCADHKQLSG